MVGAASDTEFPAEGIRRFDDAMDILAEHMRALGFPYTLYTHIEAPRRPDGSFNRLPLTVRNFPKYWDRLWHRYARFDPFYHASFNTSYVVNWQQVKQGDGISDIQREACSYLEDLGMSQGITVPIHHHGGGFSAISAICGTSDVDWPTLFRQTSENIFVTAHRFQEKYWNLYVSEHGKGQHCILSAREMEIIR